MNLPFNSGQFFDVFQNYNNSVFPAQIIFNITALMVIFLVARKNKYSDAIIILCLAFFWLWIGIIYHIIYFSVINPGAYFFGTLFILQSILFVYYGNIKKILRFSYIPGVRGHAGMILIFYALILYPLIGYLSGHVFPKAPTFGLPCPTTIFTLGILLMADKHFPFKLIIIPVIWSIIGFFAAVKLGIYEDTGLLVSGAAGLIFWFAGKNHLKKHVS